MTANPRDCIAGSLARAAIGYSRVEDAILMKRTARGDEEALRTIYDRYCALAFSLSLYILRDQQSAEEILHEVFLRLWRGAHRHDWGRESLTVWIADNARTLAIKQLRLRRRDGGLTNTVSMVNHGRGHESTELAHQGNAQVRTVFDNLSQPQREVLELAYFGGFSCLEIATKTGESLSTVKSRIRLGLQNVGCLPVRTDKEQNSIRGIGLAE